MVSVTLSIPVEVKSKMEEFSEINWSGFIRKVILEKTQELEWKEKLKNQLKNEEDINKWSLNLDSKIKEDRLKELRKKGLL